MILRLAAGDRPHRKGAKRHPLDRRHHDMRHVIGRKPVLASGGSRKAWSRLNGMNCVMPTSIAHFGPVGNPTGR
jgi:hypothetical protein